MKKQIIIATLALGAIVFGTNNVQAQIDTDQTTVNITLEETISIDVVGALVVDFNYATAQSYNQLQNWNYPNSLIVTSTNDFDIHVKADGANFESGGDLIPVEVLTITPTVGTVNPMIGGALLPVVLSTTNQPLITGANPGSAVSLNLDFLIPAAESSSPKILGKPSGTYTQTVTYTATAL